MLAFTHIAAGCASSLLVSGVLNAQPLQTILVSGGGILGSMQPDIDHPQSAFGKRALPLSISIAGKCRCCHIYFARATMSLLL
ncbi:MAG: metal-dependent hydrolase [Nitrosomonadales bacterium]|nr:metal-dependent hydrolase [Nitrosomonadales bacterium]